MGNNRFLLVGNGPYSNRGCEAIVRGTVKTLRSVFDSPTFTNMNFTASDPPHAGPDDQDPGIVHRPLRRIVKWTPRWMAIKATTRLYPSIARHLQFADIGTASRHCCAALSIGGDNYTLDYGIPRTFLQMDEYLVGCGIPTILWGHSIGPFEDAPEFAKAIVSHFQRDVTGFFVREQRSLDYLSRCGLSAKTYLMPDPAFVMDSVPVENGRIGVDLQKTKAIGLNMSPLMARHVTNGSIADLKAVTVQIVDALRRALSMPVVLIPHVTSPHSNDHAFLQSVMQSLADKERVFCLPDDLSAAETKWVISKLCCLIAARTHATIAAFSSCVPTVSLAYSRKAYGINEVLFGNREHVISPDELCPDRVLEKVHGALQQAPAIRAHLHEHMRSVHERMREAGLTLKGLIKEYD